MDHDGRIYPGMAIPPATAVTMQLPGQQAGQTEAFHRSAPHQYQETFTSDMQHSNADFAENQDDDDDEEDVKAKPGNGKKNAGRRKINIEYIDDKSRRHITFSKRKAGIMKKAYELSTLTRTQVLLLVASETGHVYTFATPKLQPLITKDEGKKLIQLCLNTPDPTTGPAATEGTASSSTQQPHAFPSPNPGASANATPRLSKKAKNNHASAEESLRAAAEAVGLARDRDLTVQQHTQPHQSAPQHHQNVPQNNQAVPHHAVRPDLTPGAYHADPHQQTHVHHQHHQHQQHHMLNPANHEPLGLSLPPIPSRGNPHLQQSFPGFANAPIPHRGPLTNDLLGHGISDGSGSKRRAGDE